MSNRQTILDAVKKNQPPLNALAEIQILASGYSNPMEKFSTVLTGIGGTTIVVKTWNDITASIKDKYHGAERIVSTCKHITVTPGFEFTDNPHNLENVDLAIMEGKFGVAENGAIWITDENMGDRALPFIAQHLALVIKASYILQTMHEAYECIGLSAYELGTFIAGPSKTADIEQSLVLGAHGAKSLTVFIME